MTSQWGCTKQGVMRLISIDFGAQLRCEGMAWILKESPFPLDVLRDAVPGIQKIFQASQKNFH